MLILIGLCFSLFNSLRAERLPDRLPGPAAPEPGRAMSRPSGAPNPQQMAAESPQERDQRRA